MPTLPNAPEHLMPLMQQEEEEQTPSRQMDEEIRLISQIVRSLSRVSPMARARIMTYISDRAKEEAE